MFLISNSMIGKYQRFIKNIAQTERFCGIFCYFDFLVDTSKLCWWPFPQSVIYITFELTSLFSIKQIYNVYYT